MPQTLVDRPLHALIEIQERHPVNGSLEDVSTCPTKNGAYPTASAFKKDRQDGLTDLSEVPQGGGEGRTLPHRNVRHLQPREDAWKGSCGGPRSLSAHYSRTRRCSHACSDLYTTRGGFKGHKTKVRLIQSNASLTKAVSLRA